VAARLSGGLSLPLQLAAAGVAAVAGVFASRTTRGATWGIAITIAAFFAGSASYDLHRKRLRTWESLPPRESRLSLRIERTFAQADPKRCSGLGTVVAADGPSREIVGHRAYFSCTVRAADPSPRRSMVVAMVGILSPLPAEPPADSFDGYLASSGVNFRLARARLVRIEQPQSRYYRFCDVAAARLKEILGWGIAEKRPALAGLLRAMMLGETRELTEDQHTIFMQSGTMHLFAISGLNIGVIAVSLETLLLLVRLPPWARFAIGTPLLWLFVDITGGAPSAVRAFAMAVFFRGAFVVRRPANPVAAIVASAAIVLLLSPLQLFSASFLMSYGIVLALLLLGLPLAEVWLKAWTPWRDLPRVTWTSWQKRIHDAWEAIVLALAIGVATTLVSLLTSILFFRLLTPGALVANLVLIPAAMVVTVGGFVSILCGLAGFATGAVVCNHAAALVLLLIEELVRWSVKIPGAFLGAQFKAAWIGPLALAAVLGAILFGYGCRWQWCRGGWAPPFALVALTLAFGVRYG
jgi:competence protein ComEC